MSHIPPSQLSYVHGSSEVQLFGETIGSHLHRIASTYPHHDALVCAHQDYRATYAELMEQTAAVAKGLIALGLQAGDRIGIWSPNCYEWVLLQYATARIGIIMVNLNPAYRTHELIYALNQSGVRVVFSALQFKTSNYRQMLRKSRVKCPGIQKEIYWGASWTAFLDGGRDVTDDTLAEWEAAVQFDDPVNIQYTSGTTGHPKGVTLSHHNILNNGFFIGERMNFSAQDRVCIPVPFFHCFGMVLGNMACTTHGAAMIIPNDSFNAKITLEVVERERCTALYGVPTMFIGELEELSRQAYDLSSLRTGIMAGSVCPPEVMKKVKEEMNMHEITICYGMTETSPVSTQTRIGAPFDKQIYSVGTIHDHVEIKIIDSATGRILPRGVAGEICTRGYSVMLGYWNDPEGTARVIDRQRWMHTGDLGSIDAEGYVYIEGRIKDLIIRGGENISPKEIEDFLYAHPGVMDVQVIGVPSEKYGEEIMAWIICKEGMNLTEDDLRAFCKDQIAHYKVPKYWKFVSEFPMTVAGKVRKVEMREIAARELAGQTQ